MLPRIELELLTLGKMAVRQCQDFVRSVFGPPILVLATDDAEAVCIKNELTFVQMLRPFSQTEAPSVKSESFHLRYLSLSDLARPSIKAAQRLTGQYVMDTAIPIDLLASDKSFMRSGSRNYFFKRINMWFDLFGGFSPFASL